METVFYTLGMVLLWVLNLVKSTGLGMTYKILELTKACCLIVAFIMALRKIRRERPLLIRKEAFFTVLLLFLVFILSSLQQNNYPAALDYLWTYLVVFILSETRPTRNALLLTGLAYGVMGLTVMAVYAFTDILKGWDGNSVAMVGLSSFLIFLAPHFGIKNLRNKLILVASAVVFGFLFWQTNSRSCIITAALTLLLFFGIFPSKRLLTSQRMHLLVLVVPLLVAATIAIIASVWDLGQLDAWSMEKFNKPIFNGRDQVWLEGFSLLNQNRWFGTGVLNGGYWHNSALACLTAYGIIGYLLWTILFQICMARGIVYAWDPCVAGLTVCFIAIILQQSVELGLIAPNPNLLPYAMLGLLIGRCNLLREES